MGWIQLVLCSATTNHWRELRAQMRKFLEFPLFAYFLTHILRTYVEVIHTSGGINGYMDPIGQADFYPNFGRYQPGCSVDLFFCSHLRVIYLFAESLNNNRFKAKKCLSYNEIIRDVCTSNGDRFLMGGEPSNSNLQGIFYLKTNAVSPFAMSGNRTSERCNSRCNSHF